MDALEAFQERAAQSCRRPAVSGLLESGATAAFDTHLRLAVRLLNAPKSLLVIACDDGDFQFLLHRTDRDERGLIELRSESTNAFCSEMMRCDMPVSVPDIRYDAALRQDPLFQELGVAACIAVPIHTPCRTVVGAIFGIDHLPRDWEAEEIGALMDLATCVDDEISHRTAIKTHEECHERVRSYNALREMITLAFIAPDLGLRERFRALLRTSCEALGMESAVIARIDGDRIEMLFRHGPAYDELLGREIPFSNTLASVVVSGQEQICLPDLPRSQHKGRYGLGGRQPACFVGIPLICDGVVFGVLEFCNRKPCRDGWSEEELSMLSLISMFACSLIGILEQVNSLQSAEAALFHELSNSEREAYMAFVR